MKEVGEFSTTPPIMRAYVINMDSARDRWKSMEEAFAATRIPLVRIPAVDRRGLTFPHPQYAEHLYHWFHGRQSNPSEVGCYLSHVAACHAFLATEERHALICEDDVNLRPDFESTLNAAMAHAGCWNVLRLTGLAEGVPLTVRWLVAGRRLCISLGRLKGAGVYVVDRAAAAAFAERLLPMRLPWDHALDREWFCGLKAAYVLPFPASQTERGFRTSIQNSSKPKLPRLQRWLCTYPYQAVNELTRWIARGWHFLNWKFSGQ
jgi:glycosyl transferase family 25